MNQVKLLRLSIWFLLFFLPMLPILWAEESAPVPVLSSSENPPPVDQPGKLISHQSPNFSLHPQSSLVPVPTSHEFLQDQNPLSPGEKLSMPDSGNLKDLEKDLEKVVSSIDSNLSGGPPSHSQKEPVEVEKDPPPELRRIVILDSPRKHSSGGATMSMTEIVSKKAESNPPPNIQRMHYDWDPQRNLMRTVSGKGAIEEEDEAEVKTRHRRNRK